MLSILKEELAEIGLEMHPSKTKVLSSKQPPGVNLVDIGDDFIQVLDVNESYRYLGRLLNLDVRKRVGIELQNRINIAWGKFHHHRTWLMNSQVSVPLRLRLFDACVSPAMLFATSVLPLGRKDLEAVNIVQRKMLRLIVG